MSNIEKANKPEIDTKKLSDYLDVMGLAAQLNEKEKKQFIEISLAFGLNPFKREIYCAKYGTQLSIITGYEVYVKRAERSGMLDGWEVKTEGDVQAKTLKAIITIYRKDRGRPFVHEVHYSEYVQTKSDGTPNKFWKEKPITMTKKVAIAQGFRLCFSDEIGGMPYTSEEILNEDAFEDVTNNPKYATADTIAPPVKVSVVEPTAEYIKEGIDAIKSCNDLACLKSIWDKYKIIKKNPDFLKAKEDKKAELEHAEKVANDLKEGFNDKV